MTAQISDKPLFEGEKHAMCMNPLGDYCALGGEVPNFASNCTSLWRGYGGMWEVINDRLYLVGHILHDWLGSPVMSQGGKL